MSKVPFRPTFIVNSLIINTLERNLEEYIGALPFKVFIINRLCCNVHLCFKNI